MAYSKDVLKNLEIFWNEKSKSPRSKLSEYLAAFIETGDIADPTFNTRMNFFKMKMSVLERDGLVEHEDYKGFTVWSLTTKGHLTLIRKHPRLKIVLQNFIESTPALVVILSGIIGLIASIAGLIQFYSWLFP